MARPGALDGVHGQVRMVVMASWVDVVKGEGQHPLLAGTGLGPRSAYHRPLPEGSHMRYLPPR